MPALSLKSDAQLHKDVLDELHWDPRVEETEVGVQVASGIVTLSGTITSYAKKLAAQEAAHRVAGVRDVANDIEVRASGGQVKSDAEIARAVRHALEWDVMVPDDRIHSTVTRGWVTLEGNVDTMAQREDAARAVHRLSGVVGVTNKIDVASRELTSNPELIREAIESALERRVHRETADLSIEISSGVAVLSGTVHSLADRHAILAAASCAPGVRGVEDHLVVDPGL